MPTVTRTLPPVAFWNSSAIASETGKTVDDPSTAIVPLSVLSATGAASAAFGLDVDAASVAAGRLAAGFVASAAGFVSVFDAGVAPPPQALSSTLRAVNAPSSVRRRPTVVESCVKSPQ